MIPIRDENPTRITPYVVYALIALNILLYIIDWIGTHNGIVYNSSGFPVGQMPITGLWDYTMIPAQIIKNNPNLPAVIKNVYIPHHSPAPVWFTIFTSMFLHGGLLHLGGNMLYLWIFGNNIEEVLGHFKFLLFYLAGGVLAALAHIYSDPTSTIPTLGASGAIAAVLGAYIVLYPRNTIDCLIFLGFFVTTVAVPAVVVLGVWFVLQFINVTAGPLQGGGVAYWAHIGGFIAGMILILFFGGRRKANQVTRRDTYYNGWND